MFGAMKDCVIFGGRGYIGSKLCERLLAVGLFERIVLVDTSPFLSELEDARVVQLMGDVREPISAELDVFEPSWIFNFAAVHREPGHAFEEYFDTNVPGAEHVTDYARRVSCLNILFTSSIAVYGPTRGATDEETAKYPSTGYGISKLWAEQIHERWQAEDSARRLVTCRPGVIYGAGDPGNILRMIRAVQKGVFFFPGSPNIYKSYGYIEGLLDSFLFAMKVEDAVWRYNYVETPTEPLNELVAHIQSFLKIRARTIPLPLWMLVPVAAVVQLLTGGRSGIHPKRVRKAATPTHIIPKALVGRGFEFKYDFRTSLQDWERQCPEDFGR